VVLTVAAGLPYLAAFAWVAVSEVVLLLLGNALLVRLRALPSGGLNVCVLPFIYVGVQEALDAMGAERDTGSRLVDRLSVLLR
jgi:hypothetical protein